MSVKLSIIVPCYKVERYLSRCLDSLVNQTLNEIEAICINDGSPDNCLDILKRYKKLYPDKIVIIDKENEGVWKGRRDGIRIARGEYIGFLDSDDYALPTFAEDLYRTAKQYDADIAVCGFNRVDMETEVILTEEMTKPRNNFLIGSEPGRLLELNGAPWNKIFRSCLLKDLPDLENRPAILDDLIFHLLVYIYANGKVAFCPKALVRYMIRNDSIITSIRKEQVASTFSSFAELGQLYKDKDCGSDKITMLASEAFLHLGISLLFRLTYDPSCNCQNYIQECISFLDSNFSSWRSSKYLSLRYALRQGGAFLKLWIARTAYRLHLINMLMKMYRYAIDCWHIDIKW